MLDNKKGQTPIIKVIFIVGIVSAVLFVLWILILYQIKTFDVDERKIQTQIIIEKTLSGNCFSNDYATINIKSFKENFDNCFKESQEKKTSFARFVLDYKNGNKVHYINKDEFEQKANLCRASSTLLCTEMQYPVIIINEDNAQEIGTLKLQIITT